MKKINSPRIALLTSIFTTAIIGGIMLTPMAASASEEAAPTQITVSAPATEVFPESELDSVASVPETSAILNSRGKRIAEDEARKYGVSVKWVSGNQACPGVNSLGCYTAGKGPVITLVNSMQDGGELGIRNVVRHESAHHAIAVACGTTRPGIVGARVENVTDAYAATFYGMSTKNLSYGFNSNDVSIAKKIRNGYCYSTQKSVTVQSNGWGIHMFRDNRSNSVSRNIPIARNTKLTYLSRDGGNAIVRDSHGNFGYIDINAITNPTNLKQVTVTDTSVVPLRQSDRKQVFVKHGEKIRLTNTSAGSGYLVGITNDGKGEAVYIHNSTYATPKGTATVRERTSPYEITNGMWKHCANCLSSGAKVTVMGAYSAGFTKVVYKGRTFVVDNSKLSSTTKPSNPSKPSAPSKPSTPNADSNKGKKTLSVYRFWSSNFNNAHFFTSNASEAKSVREKDKNWTYQGEAFKAYAPVNGKCSSDTNSVYRFWSAKFQSHFYTTSPSEVNSIRKNDANWSYEGLMFCEPKSSSGNVAVYRFWSPKFGKHFYTSNAGEMQKLRYSDPSWNYEGIAWYAPKK